MKTSASITKIIQAARDSRDADGCAHIASKDVAKLIKARLNCEFPGVKFRVTSDFNSINVHWEGFPMRTHVEKIISAYKFGGFDGSIDMAYSSECWLLPDGRIVPAACKGTKGQRGDVTGFATDCPQPGAVLVRGGARYICACQGIPASVWESSIRSVMEARGLPDQLFQSHWSNCTIDGDFAHQNSDVRACVERTLDEQFQNLA